MATVAGTQAVLGVNGKNAKIVKQIPGTTNQNYVLGGAVAPGKGRWIPTTAANNDATQAAAILAGLV